MIRLIGLIILLLTLPVSVNAQEDAFVEGEHYKVLSRPVHVRDPNKIEVLEFFWYGCSHCYNFEPLVKQWKKTAAEDVDFVASPAIWPGRESMKTHARAYYAAEAMGVLDVMHDALFAAMNIDRKPLANDQQVTQLFVANGIDEGKFQAVFNSFGVNSQTRLAESRAKSAKITGTPELLVAGKYRITTRTAGGPAQMLAVADYLVKKERAALAGGAYNSSRLL